MTAAAGPRLAGPAPDVRIGVNVATASSFRIALDLWRLGLVDFFELVIDNFVHLAPDVVARSLGDRPVSFHVMASGFLDHDPHELAPLATRLRSWIATLRPLYVSDHLARHRVGGRPLPDTAEADYGDDALFDGVARWQEMLGHELLLENYPSGDGGGADQPAFFAELHRRCGAAPLFDFSNAVVAQGNGGPAARAWLSAVEPAACHISGYRNLELERPLLVDSHDCAVSDESWRFLRDAVAAGHAPASIVVERDDNLDDAGWATDLARARDVVRSGRGG